MNVHCYRLVKSDDTISNKMSGSLKFVLADFVELFNLLTVKKVELTGHCADNMFSKNDLENLSLSCIKIVFRP